MTSSEQHHLEALADRFFAAVAAGDVDAVRAIYTADATIWHNFDEVDQTPAQNAETLQMMQRLLKNIRYEDVRRSFLDDGWVQQHLLRATGRNGELSMPAMMRIYVDGDGERITRLEEYLDPAQFARAVARPAG